jgi:hypothetical protein
MLAADAGANLRELMERMGHSTTRRIPAIFAGHRSGPALLRTGNGYPLPASGGRVAAGEHFRVTGGREP